MGFWEVLEGKDNRALEMVIPFAASVIDRATALTEEVQYDKSAYYVLQLDTFLINFRGDGESTGPRWPILVRAKGIWKR